MDEIIITSDIELKPDKLDYNIKDHIAQELQNKVGNCNKKYGYILEIIDILSIVNKSISNTSSNIVFSVKYKAKNLKPEINNVISCKVFMIFPQGIFSGINDMKILIPDNELSHYTFNHKENTFYNSEKTINKDDTIDIVIKSVKYMKKKYSCIGVLKE